MMRLRLPGQGQLGRLGVVALVACAAPLSAGAQAEGGLYVAGAGFSFEQAADDGLSRNPGGQRFFLLVLPPQAEALTSKASRAQAAARQRVVDGNGVLLVCRRDIDSGAMPAGQRYFPDEDPANLPQADEMLRRLRSTCS